MSVNRKNVNDAFVDELASYDDKLRATANNVDLLTEVQKGLVRLLTASGNSEDEIRKVLQERFNSGELRTETYQLVNSLLDHYVTEDLPTSALRGDQGSLDSFATTTPAIDVSVEIPPPAKVRNSEDVFRSTTVIAEETSVAKPKKIRAQVGSLLRDRFLLQEKIAGGSMGVVYKAMDRRLAEAGASDHWVAIKILSPQLAENGQALRALQQEAAKGRCLLHPNIVRFIDLDREDDLYFLVMEWLEGQTLAKILDSTDASDIDTESALRIVRQIGDALDYAHRCGIVHADIKPGNIMISSTGNAKLFDFGVARVRQQQSDSDFDPGVLGAITPAYSSMQVLTGEEPVATDDVFSLACLMYRLIAGHRVFGPRNAAEASQAGMMPQPLRALNAAQWRALKKALSYSRVARFESVKEFIDALNAKDDQPFIVEPAAHLETPDQNRRSGMWSFGFLLVALAAGGYGYQSGYLDPLVERVQTQLQPILENLNSSGDDTTNVDASVDSAITDIDPMDASETGIEAASVEELTSDSAAIADTAVEPLLVRRSSSTIDTRAMDDTELVGPESTLVDFSSLPQPTAVIPITPGGRVGPPVNISAREDGASVIIDFVRGRNLSVPLSLRLEEVGFSGNRSPWASGQYEISNSGRIYFPPGQARGRVTLQMVSDPLREADQQSTLRLRMSEFVDSELAVVNVLLEDDDQRAFEEKLPPNTVAFAASQASIRERDPAVQIDLVRFRPDNAPLEVRFTVSDITATEGRDYFAPGSYLIGFGPGQRAARLLIPLVQDSEVEGDEAFVIELQDNYDAAADVESIDVYRRIVVMIRDDDPQIN